MKVIFLDIDGVLNHAGCKVKAKSGCYFVADYKMALLQELVERTGAKIVLSSTWRYGWIDLNKGLQNKDTIDFLDLKAKFQEFGLEFLSKTPVLEDTEHCRGKEIDAWLSDWDGEPITGFCIIDDMDEVYLRPHANRIVRTSFGKGFLPKHIERAVKLLEKEVKK